MRLAYSKADAAMCQPHEKRAASFSRFKDAIMKVASATAAAAVSCFLLMTPATMLFSRAHAAEVPSSIVWTPGIDWAKQPVRDYFTSNNIPITKYTIQQEMPLGQMVPLTQKLGTAVSPFSTRNLGTGMSFVIHMSHGFSYVGGDSFKYQIVYYCPYSAGAIRARVYSGEIAKYSQLSRVDPRWSSSHPSYIFNQENAARFMLIGSIGQWTSELLREFDWASGRITDTTYVLTNSTSFQFCHAWNHGKGNWGSKRMWFGLSNIDNGYEGVSIADIPAFAKRQLVRPGVYPLPNPDSSKSFVGWVLDTVFWKVARSDSTAPYDLAARVDSARFMTAVLDTNMFYVRPYDLPAGETDTVTVKPYDVFKLPIPRRLVPFADYGGRHGELANPWYQLTNIHNPDIDYYTVNGVVISPFELVFFQDSTAKSGPWYTRMTGKVAKNVVSEGVVDTGSVFTLDSLKMWRFVRMPQAGDTSFISIGDEFNTQFRVPDSLCGATSAYDPLLCGFIRGVNYTSVGAPEPQRISMPAFRPVGPGRYEISFRDGASHEVGIYDMQGRLVRSVEAPHGHALVGLDGLPAGAYMISTEAGRSHITFRALLLR
ncbi:MAG: hypothetical protein PHV13_03950 [Candidatus ainarchaeum sp.]|nr:hypothetical protein [Candidatus ainarchaeum sp.]